MNERTRSVYALGAENGVVLGPVLTLAALLTGGTTYNVWLFLPSLAVILAVPVTAYILLKRTMREQPAAATFPALWLQGICAFFFGGAIMAVLCYAAMRWVWPEFIVDQVKTIIDVYGAVNDADARNIAHTLQQLLDSHSLPTPVDISLELLYVAVFSGSLLSMLLSFIIRKAHRSSPPQYNK